MQIEIMGYELEMITESYPEQYYVFKGDEQVGYLRLRGGLFTAECPDLRGALVYAAEPKGDGSFDADERERYLTKAIQFIDAYWKAKGGGEG